MGGPLAQDEFLPSVGQETHATADLEIGATTCPETGATTGLEIGATTGLEIGATTCPETGGTTGLETGGTMLRLMRMVGGQGLELEPFCGRERSGSPQAKS
jgi:hypothetical protein